MRYTLSLVLVLFVFNVANADFYSLCIGTNADPENTSSRKYNCVFNKDAVVMSKMLKKKGAKTKLLYGWITSQDVYMEIEGLSKKAKDGDTTFIFFSTHGESCKDDFWIMLPENDFVSGKKVICLASKIKGRVIIAADTCCAGALLRCNATNVLLIGSSREDQSAYWIENLPKREPCGYLTRPLYNVFSKTLNPTVFDIANEMNKSLAPDQTLWYNGPLPENVFAVGK
jgi:hypothetical protein